MPYQLQMPCSTAQQTKYELRMLMTWQSWQPGRGGQLNK